MSAGRILSSLAASLAVGGCAVVAIGMSRAASAPHADEHPSRPAVATRSARPAYLPRTPSTSAAARTSTRPPARTSSRPAIAPPSKSASTVHPAAAAPTPSTHPVTHPVAVHTAHVAPPPRPRPTHRAVTVRGHALPLHYATGSATRVITVTAHSHGSTTATLQTWKKASGGGWWRTGSAVTAHVGADGLGGASESRSATPTGSFTLTHAFGHYSDPGTPLPYIHTTPADWWISQAGRLYNTHQRCSSGCSFTRGDPNEHLYYETPYYNYAVVIDYNTRNAPGGVHAGKGSAFFLHVTDGAPTAGCVAIPQSRLVPIMRWLAPSTHPRILIGVT